jgi:hypothetical protein
MIVLVFFAEFHGRTMIFLTGPDAMLWQELLDELRRLRVILAAGAVKILQDAGRLQRCECVRRITQCLP